MLEHECDGLAEEFRIDNSANGYWHLIIPEYDWDCECYIDKRYNVNFCPFCGVKLGDING